LGYHAANGLHTRGCPPWSGTNGTLAAAVQYTLLSSLEKNHGCQATASQRQKIGAPNPLGRAICYASELCKHGYKVAFTKGNATPWADLMIVSPTSNKDFLIDVKGLYKPNSWPIKKKARRDSLYYVLAFVPDDTNNRFFILSQEQVNTYIRTELARLGRADDYPMPGILWKQAEAHENKWNILPQ
jgi:hypothetical protein